MLKTRAGAIAQWSMTVHDGLQPVEQARYLADDGERPGVDLNAVGAKLRAVEGELVRGADPGGAACRKDSLTVGNVSAREGGFAAREAEVDRGRLKAELAPAAAISAGSRQPNARRHAKADAKARGFARGGVGLGRRLEGDRAGGGYRKVAGGDNIAADDLDRRIKKRRKSQQVYAESAFVFVPLASGLHHPKETKETAHEVRTVSFVAL
jgi:hypothetical protein